jgi:methyl-accepting chemotaxis protein
MNFDDAMVAHLRWKFRLSDQIQGKSKETLDPKVVCRDDACDLGKWILSHSDKMSSDDYKELKSEHAVFHRNAAAVLEAVTAKKPDDAKKLLDGPYAASSANVIMLLKRIRDKAA